MDAHEPVDFEALPLDVARQIFPPLWVVYMRPDDFPAGYVVRLWYGMTPEPDAYRCATLADARRYVFVCGGSYRFDPQQGDAPAVCESWL